MTRYGRFFLTANIITGQDSEYLSLVQVAKLTGHFYRVLYLAMFPDREAIVMGAGNKTLVLERLLQGPIAESAGEGETNTLVSHMRRKYLSI